MAKLGDVFEIEIDKQKAYFQYTFKYVPFGYLIRILPGLYTDKCDNIQELVEQKQRFWIFYPLGTAIRRKLITKVGNFAIPTYAQELPPMRARGGIAKDGTVLNWYRCEGTNVQRINLTEKDLDLSLRGVANHQYLIDIIKDPDYPRSIR